jgi:hypothetical protein
MHAFSLKKSIMKNIKPLDLFDNHFYSIDKKLAFSFNLWMRCLMSILGKIFHPREKGIQPKVII